MKFTRIKYAEHPLFDSAWNLYLKSFPRHERRHLFTQVKVLREPLYHFEVITDDEQFIGILLWWDLDDVRYIEHFATVPRLRGRGYGAQILQQFIARSPLPVLLEVEHPTDPVSHRRVDFYRRAGFTLNEHPYTHPPYKRSGTPVSLSLMTYPTAITADDTTHFRTHHHPVIFAHSLS